MKLPTQLTFYSDPGHGWLQVPISLITDLGLTSQISEYSYRRGEYAYLEEDCDANKFMKRFNQAHGYIPKLEYEDCERPNTIFVRGLQRWNKGEE